MKISVPLTDIKCNTIFHCKLKKASTGNKPPPGVGAPFHLCSTNKKKAEWSVQCHQTSGNCKYEAKRNIKNKNI